jgi:hypothetical protein
VRAVKYPRVKASRCCQLDVGPYSCQLRFINTKLVAVTEWAWVFCAVTVTIWQGPKPESESKFFTGHIKYQARHY